MMSGSEASIFALLSTLVPLVAVVMVMCWFSNIATSLRRIAAALEKNRQ